MSPYRILYLGFIGGITSPSFVSFISPSFSLGTSSTIYLFTLLSNSIEFSPLLAGCRSLFVKGTYSWHKNLRTFPNFRGTSMEEIVFLNSWPFIAYFTNSSRAHHIWTVVATKPYTANHATHLSNNNSIWGEIGFSTVLFSAGYPCAVHVVVLIFNFVIQF